jgi:23S rRNA pseudouridine1911/1915/1917 synthase
VQSSTVVKQILRGNPQNQGQRLDVFLQQNLPDYSRTGIQRLIKQGDVWVNKKIAKSNYKIRSDDEICILLREPEPVALTSWTYPLDVLYEDSSLLVINKPAGMVVHPAAGHREKTLVHALLAQVNNLSCAGGNLRPGIVHRLDKETSGALIVAKTDPVHRALARQFKEGEVEKVYLALVTGFITAKSGKIDVPIGRHPVNRKKMSTSSRVGKPAITLWRVVQEFTEGISLLRVELKTGRTHQIRVHLALQGHPVIGDTTYGGKKASPNSVENEQIKRIIQRHLLHAWRIGFRHPESGKWIRLQAPLPQDMVGVLSILNKKTEKMVKEA